MKPPRATAGGFVVSRMQQPSLNILKKRAEFLAAARARRISTPAFTLQFRERAEGEAEGVRVGFTCSKKVGNAVARNRAKRRLREVARLVLLKHGKLDHDYVLIGRREATTAIKFSDLEQELRWALEKAHK